MKQRSSTNNRSLVQRIESVWPHPHSEGYDCTFSSHFKSTNYTQGYEVTRLDTSVGMQKKKAQRHEASHKNGLNVLKQLGFEYSQAQKQHKRHNRSTKDLKMTKQSN